LSFGQVDRDDLARPGSGCTDQRRQADAAEADHCDGGADSHLGGVHHRADARQDGATEQRGMIERHGRVDLDDRTARHRGMVGEHRAAEMVVQRLPVARQAPQRRTAACPDPLAAAPGSQSAGPPFCTRSAMAAARDEDRRPRDRHAAGR
jgi:hypothetical protein